MGLVMSVNATNLGHLSHSLGFANGWFRFFSDAIFGLGGRTFASLPPFGGVLRPLALGSGLHGVILQEPATKQNTVNRYHD